MDHPCVRRGTLKVANGLSEQCPGGAGRHDGANPSMSRPCLPKCSAAPVLRSSVPKKRSGVKRTCALETGGGGELGDVTCLPTCSRTPSAPRSLQSVDPALEFTPVNFIRTCSTRASFIFCLHVFSAALDRSHLNPCDPVPRPYRGHHHPASNFCRQSNNLGPRGTRESIYSHHKHAPWLQVMVSGTDSLHLRQTGPKHLNAP